MGQEHDDYRDGPDLPPVVRDTLTFVLCLLTAVAITVLIARPRIF
jgi:hypothetical protein